MSEGSGQMTLDEYMNNRYMADPYAATAFAAQNYPGMWSPPGQQPQQQAYGGPAGWDAATYLALNPDVAAAGVDPLQHWQQFGQHEGRSFTQPAAAPAPAPGPVAPAPTAAPAPAPTPTPAPAPAPTPAPAPPAPDYNAMRAALQAEGAGLGSSYFSGRGADPNKYSSQISNRIASALAGIPNDQLGGTAANLFAGVPANLYNELATGYRNTARTAFDAAQPSTPFTSTLDDPMIESILGEQRGSADRFISNMLNRGQIDDFGAGRARAELDRQAGVGRTSLNELGGGLIDTRQGQYASDLGTRRSAFDTLALDAPYSTAAPNMASLTNDFMFSLGNQLRQGAGNIFSTAGLQGVAGGGPSSFSNQRTPFTARGGGARTPGGGATDDDENVLF